MKHESRNQRQEGTTKCRKLHLRSHKGFSLVDILLYIGLASFLLTGTSAAFSELLSARIKTESISEVQTQGQHIMQLILQTIRNAESITSPTAGNSAAALTIETDAGTTMFDVSSNIFRITEDLNPPEAITSSRIIPSNISFTNLTRTEAPGTIRVSFILSHVNFEGRNEYDVSETFIGTANLQSSN